VSAPRRADEVDATEEGEPSPTEVSDRRERAFGRYRLCFELASGGMATVYLARAEGPAGFEKLVALKRIHPHLARDRKFVDMFLDEARIASMLSHPNVCGVFDFGDEGGSYYLAMEYLVGETLSKVLRTLHRNADLRSSPRLPSIAARLIADACEGLHAAHELRDPRGEWLHVVHRDVSPQNLFLTYDGTVKVVDFGIARAKDKVHQTDTGTVKGKFAYMAPEQLHGHDIDRRADVWSLGVVLWEMLAMRRLFKRPTDAETIIAVSNQLIPDPSEVREHVPEALDEVVSRALRRDPAERYATAREMGRDLLRFVASQPDPVGTPDVSEWMEEVFPGGRERRTQLADLARQRPDESIPVVSDEEGSAGSLSRGHSRVRAASLWAQPKLRRRAMVGAGAVLLLGGVFAAGLALGGGGSGATGGRGDESASGAPGAAGVPATAAVETPDAGAVPVDATAAIGAPTGGADAGVDAGPTQAAAQTDDGRTER